MKQRLTSPHLVALMLAAALSANAAADEVRNIHEVALLPAYCRGTQLIRAITRDPKPMAEYALIYGNSFYHLHHYCWALHTENKYRYAADINLRNSKLINALADIQYLLQHGETGFVLLPEVYTTQARILFTLKREGEAVLALNYAIEAKPDHVPAIVRLSDYYVEKRDQALAIKVLEQGIDYTEQADTLIKKLEALGKTYPGQPGHARVKPESKPATPADAAPGSEDTRSEAEKKANPYCRFCP